MKKNILVIIFLLFISVSVFSDELYTIQIGAFREERNSSNLLKKLLIYNLPAYIKEINGLSYVYNGLYNSKTDAEFDKEFLEKILNLKTIIKKCTLKEGEIYVDFAAVSKNKIFQEEAVESEKKNIISKDKAAKISKITYEYNYASTDFSSKNSIIDNVIIEVKKYLNVRYKFGGTSNKGVDCSGLTYLVFRKFNIYLPRTTNEQSKIGKSVEKNNLKKGDFIFFYKKIKSIPTHLGIYIGNNKFIHASNANNKVMISDLDETYFRNHFHSAKRIDFSDKRISSSVN